MKFITSLILALTATATTAMAMALDGQASEPRGAHPKCTTDYYVCEPAANQCCPGLTCQPYQEAHICLKG